MRYLFVLTLALLASAAHAALGPDNLLLVVNKNVPEGLKLAEFYRTARGVPEGRIVSLNLPPADDVSFSIYEPQVVGGVRNYLRAHQLEDKVTCIVTFYGVPLRVAQRVATAAERKEIADLTAEQPVLLKKFREKVEALEAESRRFDPSFRPGTGDTIEPLAARLELAIRPLIRQINETPDPAVQRQRVTALIEALKVLTGPASVVKRMTAPGGAPPGQTEEEKARFEELAAQIRKTEAEISQLQEKRYDAEARVRLRKLVGETYGLLELTRLVGAHAEYLTSANSISAFDSELSMLWWDFYPRASGYPNILNYQFPAPAGAKFPKTLMVMRLDAPQAGMVREMILASGKAERDGLVGKVVLDSRGIEAKGKNADMGSYGWYDQSIRNLANILRTKTKMPLLHDDSPELLAEHAATNVALYCGWYKVGSYVPVCHFVSGAVGFHVASFELVTLKKDNGWCRGLINDGIAATLGPVDEPFLAAFPPADEFFPLLLTGKMTLAEVYWKTTPMSSWMISMIGDPLYVPFKTNPQLKVEDLPEKLRPMLETPVFGGQ